MACRYNAERLDHEVHADVLRKAADLLDDRPAHITIGQGRAARTSRNLAALHRPGNVTDLMYALNRTEALLLEHHAYGAMEQPAPDGFCPVCYEWNGQARFDANEELRKSVAAKFTR